MIISDDSKSTYFFLSITSASYLYAGFILSMIFSSPSDAVERFASFFLTLILRFPSLSESLSLSDFLSINYDENFELDDILQLEMFC